MWVYVGCASGACRKRRKKSVKSVRVVVVVLGERYSPVASRIGISAGQFGSDIVDVLDKSLSYFEEELRPFRDYYNLKQAESINGDLSEVRKRIVTSREMRGLYSSGVPCHIV